jgi:hypothetical protein
MPKTLETSPMKSLAEELDLIRKKFRQCLDVYATRVEQDLLDIRQAVLDQAKSEDIQSGQIRDLRDMLTLCRTLDIKTEKGRRKDLKKFDTLIQELQLLSKNW